ncbi:fluoride efflux transporter FluC [Halomonas sp. HNIBRBA4712]|uniref:fluoride efflux transporter FluC n=1 Tax=Halomonas sp. HNIBRBA4712 TaxID=3373087 RepID=UPI003745D7EB
MKTVKAYALVGLGTALGSLCRYAVSLAVLATLGDAFPWGTLLANALGSCLIGWLAARATYAPHGGWARAQAFWVSGFCAGFTTFSLFSLELLHLMQSAAWLALGYTLTSIALWLLGVALGERLARPIT